MFCDQQKQRTAHTLYDTKYISSLLCWRFGFSRSLRNRFGQGQHSQICKFAKFANLCVSRPPKPLPYVVYHLLHPLRALVSNHCVRVCVCVCVYLMRGTHIDECQVQRQIYMLCWMDSFMRGKMSLFFLCEFNFCTTPRRSHECCSTRFARMR